MPALNRIANFATEMENWRKYLHMHPEIGFECFKTAQFVADRLKEFGVDEIHEKIAKTGIVAIIHGKGEGKTIGLRADMDALPIFEKNKSTHISKFPGKMHACGHDGHTTMLLGAAKYLAETRNFSGSVALIFQPAEEGQGGGRVMCEEGIFERFAIEKVFALHCDPNSKIGTFKTRPGPIMAATSSFEITITGQGGHGAMPHKTCDPIVALLSIAQAIQTIVSRNHHSADDLVISVTQIHSGTATNIVPEKATIGGTVRTINPKVQEMVIKRMNEIVEGHAQAFNVDATLDYKIGYPATLNDTDCAAFGLDVAAKIGATGEAVCQMGAEDFSYMLEKCPGAYLFLGQGEGVQWHHPEFEFNDEIAPLGASFFARLVEMAQPISA